MQNLDTINDPVISNPETLDQNRTYNSEEVLALIQNVREELSSQYDKQLKGLQENLIDGRRHQAEAELKAMGLRPELSTLMDFSTEDSYLGAMEIIQKSFLGEKVVQEQKKGGPVKEALRKVMGLPVE
jgi:hypothetical protein